MSVNVVTSSNFDEIINSKEIVLVDFWASWCGPCRMLSPIVDEFANEHPEIAVGKINIDEESQLASQFNVMSIPTLMVFKNGKPYQTSVGVVPKAKIETLIK